MAECGCNHKKIRIAVLVSGGGTNLQALIDAERDGVIQHGEIVLVVSDRPGAYALSRAGLACIRTCTVDRKSLGSQAEFEAELTRRLGEAGVELIVLAGFLNILSSAFTDAWDERIINVHPSLIPAFCGKGFYGLRVHEAALARGVKLTGATVHFVNGIPDGGRIIRQRAVEVKPGDTPEILQARVMREAEWVILPQATEEVCAGMAHGKQD